MVSADASNATQSVYADSNVVNNFTLEDARAMKAPSEKILCTLADNKYIRFGEYSVVDHDSKMKLMHVTEEMNRMTDGFAR